MKFVRLLILGVILLGVVVGGYWAAGRVGVELINPLELMGRTVKIEGPPEIYGWVAWWKEQQAYDLVASRAGQIKSVSPVWWRINEEMESENTGKMNRKEIIAQMKQLGVLVIPSLGSEMTGEKLSPLFNDKEVTQKVIAELITGMGSLEIDGLDVDLEGIAKSDRESFVQFLSEIKKIAEAQNLRLSVTIQAQDGKNFWFGAEGQDIKAIGEIADEVRIMAYDRHSASSDPGAIAPLDWNREVASYNLKLIPREKIVMGVPSYGYIWPEGGSAKGLQWDEFYEYLEGEEYASDRDRGSGELEFSGDGFVGWLSDGEAMRIKIEQYRKLGLNRFAIWHLGGLDGEFFDITWQTN